MNCMPSEIGDDLIYYKTMQGIWHSSKEIFSNKENTARVFEVKATLYNLRQGNLSII